LYLQLDCSLENCRFDNFECTGGRHPWRKCENKCGNWIEFNENGCDEACNNQDCLFDAFDCINRPECNDTCSSLFDNGICDNDCNSSACAYDGLDCEKDKGKWLSGHNILGTLRIRFTSMLSVRELAYHLSRNLTVILKVQDDHSGQPSAMMMPNNDTVK